MKIALLGFGKMGRAVEAVAEAEGHEILLRLDVDANRDGEGITAAAMRGVDVAIDFSWPEAVVTNVERAAGLGIDLVVGTTGWYDRLDDVAAFVKKTRTGLIYAPNFSIGVHLFFRLARLAGRLANSRGGYDLHCREEHHRHKRDPPSGTALRLAEIVLEEVDRKRRWVELSGAGGMDAADPEALVVEVVREGDATGTHLLVIDGEDDRIELRHTAKDRRAFARGAVAAAEWIRGRRGLFTIDDLLDGTAARRGGP